MSNESDDESIPHVHGPGCHHDHTPKVPIKVVKRPGRNEPCWCGSGSKYKKCHYPTDR